MLPDFLPLALLSWPALSGLCLPSIFLSLLFFSCSGLFAYSQSGKPSSQDVVANSLWLLPWNTWWILMTILINRNCRSYQNNPLLRWFPKFWVHLLSDKNWFSQAIYTHFNEKSLFSEGWVNRYGFVCTLGYKNPESTRWNRNVCSHGKKINIGIENFSYAVVTNEEFLTLFKSF